MQTGIELRCPKCYSAKVIVDKQGAAPSVTDHISLLEGTVNQSGLRLSCRQCGASFVPSEARMAQHPDGAATAMPDSLVATPTVIPPPEVTTPAGNEAQVNHIIQIVQQQGKINAIKYCRDTYNMGLKEAKDYVDRIMIARGLETKGGCFIATACYGDYEAAEVKVLRQYRDQVLRRSLAGRAFIRFYYAVSPGLAASIRRSSVAKRFIRRYLLDALVRRTGKILQQ